MTLSFAEDNVDLCDVALFFESVDKTMTKQELQSTQVLKMPKACVDRQTNWGIY